MKRYLIFVFGLIVFSFLFSSNAQAGVYDFWDSVDRKLYQDAGQDSLEFKPQVPIPDTQFGSQTVNIKTGDAIGTYIVSLYQYGAGIAGLVALFMIVLAGWKWLMAAGNSEKISTAKDTIQGALIGLFLLFGGYLLLSQISTRLVQFDTLSLPAIETREADDEYCRRINATVVDSIGCGTRLPVNATSTITGDTIVCIDTSCADLGEGASCVIKDKLEDCPSSVPISGYMPECQCVKVDCTQISECNQYPTRDSCINNTCYIQMNKVCGLEEGKTECEPIEDVACDSNADCFVDLDGGGTSEYCCENQKSLGIDWLNPDECKLIAPGVVCLPN